MSELTGSSEDAILCSVVVVVTAQAHWGGTIAVRDGNGDQYSK